VNRAPTGDPQLDRVQQIDINAVRDQNRMGGAAPGPATAAPPAGANAMGAAPPPNGSAMGAAPTNGGPAVGAPPANGTAAAGGPGVPDNKDVKKEDPVYKKWWFWAVVGVSAYVVYSIATESSHDNTTGRVAPTARTQPGGLTLFSW
jgi:hypothetical protein